VKFFVKMQFVFGAYEGFVFIKKLKKITKKKGFLEWLCHT